MTAALNKASLLTALCMVSLLIGCGGDAPDHPPTTAVTGTVTQGGKPVDGATVSLVPQDSAGQHYSATGTTDASGRFTAYTYFSPSATEAGVLPGEYKVTVTKAPPVAVVEGHGSHDAAPAGPASTLPLKYADANATPLKATVAQGSASDLDLKLE